MAAGMRTIPLAQSMITVPKEWKLRTKRKTPDDLLFPSKRGTCIADSDEAGHAFESEIGH